MYGLTATHLELTCEASAPLRLEAASYRAGSNLRGALGRVMQRAYCYAAGPGSDRAEPNHAATCPVCWLLAANERPGEERRGYALTPPVTEPPEGYWKAGERFQFGVTLFGEARKFLPYFLLAVPEVGRMGVGPGRGRFVLRSVDGLNALTGAREAVLAEGESLVRVPQQVVNQAEVEAEAARWLKALDDRGPRAPVRVQVEFVTPMRLIVDGELLKAPDFAVLFARLLKRLDELEEQFAGGQGRPRAEVESLQALAAQVRLMQADTRWVEVRSGSTRTGKVTWTSGFVGRAVYGAPREVWAALMPWLLWGQVAQVGKDTVKGNGVMRIADGG